MDHQKQEECRMYRNTYPEVDEYVLVQVKNVAEMGAYVELLEYNNIEGMILLSELSRRRIRSINKLIRVGRMEVVVVLRVDKEKGYIDLSKRRVSPDDIQRCEERYNKSKAVHSIIRHISNTNGVRMEDLYNQFGWDLYDRFGHAYDAFRLMVSEDKAEEILGPYNLDPRIKKDLITNIERRLTPQVLKIRADIEVKCLHYEGIDAVKAALVAGQAVGDGLPEPVKIKLVAPPLYVMMTNSMDKEAGVALLSKACQEIERVITAKGGDLVIKVAPRAVSERDDRLLMQLMETLEKQNQEVAGDDPEEDDD